MHNILNDSLLNYKKYVVNILLPDIDIKDVLFKPSVMLFHVTEAIKVDPYVYLNVSLTDSPVVFDNGFELNVKVRSITHLQMKYYLLIKKIRF